MRILPVQVAEASRTYAWNQNAATVDGIVTLTTGAEEDAGFVRVFFASLNVWLREDISVAFLPSYSPSTSLALLLSAKIAGVRCIMMNESHAGTERATGVKRKIKQLLVSLFDGAILGGTPHLRHFEKLGMPPSRMVTGYDAVDNKYFSEMSRTVRDAALAYREKLNLPERYILSLGRMVEKKNLKLLIEAYGIFKRKNPECGVKLVFVGSGECHQSLVEQCERLGLRQTAEPGADPEATVFFYGFRQIDENPVFYALAESFVLPSLYEEWGLVVNEAMACGLPVLVSNTVGCSEDLVFDGVNGYTFDPESAVQLAQHIEDVVLDPVRNREMGKESQRIIEGWGCENFAENALKILNIVGTGN